MKKTSLRFILLAAVLGITSWISLHSAVEAGPLPLCTTYDGTSCHSQGLGATVQCRDPYAMANTYCVCQHGYPGEPSLAWHCAYL